MPCATVKKAREATPYSSYLQPSNSAMIYVMRHQEKKYRVESFEDVMKILHERGAKKVSESVTHHFYGVQDTDDVTKLVVYEDRSEIHILIEDNGKFTLQERIAVDSQEEGMKWLNSNGFTKTQEVKMQNIDYEYDDGVVGLYIINDSLHSVILDFPAEQHDQMEQLFGLESAEVITQPYNKYLSQK